MVCAAERISRKLVGPGDGLTMPQHKSSAGWVIAALVALPLLGAWLDGRPLAAFFAFPPPLDIPRHYPRFSWLAAGSVIALALAVAYPWVRRGLARGPLPTVAAAKSARSGRLPMWGWVALAWTGAWWVLAWNRWEWFAPAQRYTFFPLWLGFIVSVNALTERRTGSCFLRRHPARWLSLFGVSALCWWAFEWLNRFVRNWHYLNVQDFGALAYALHASLCFSTVLPAVLAVAEWIGSHPGWWARTSAGPRWTWLNTRGAALALVGFGGVSLAGTGAFPLALYPALWVGPLALQLGLPALRGAAGLAGELAAGDWRRAATWMIAALGCGFFWEMWNWYSLARWIYTVPGVERWQVFEMPLLGYVGYLPFGLECLLVARWVGIDEAGPLEPSVHSPESGT